MLVNVCPFIWYGKAISVNNKRNVCHILETVSPILVFHLVVFNKKNPIVNNFHLLTENQRLPNMLGQRLYNMLGQRLYNMLGQRLYNMFGQRLYNMLGQRFLDEQSADGFASRNQRWPKENCSLRPNVSPTSTCYMGRPSTGTRDN